MCDYSNPSLPKVSKLMDRSTVWATDLCWVIQRPRPPVRRRSDPLHSARASRSLRRARRPGPNQGSFVWFIWAQMLRTVHTSQRQYGNTCNSHNSHLRISHGACVPWVTHPTHPTRRPPTVQFMWDRFVTVLEQVSDSISASVPCPLGVGKILL